MQNIDYLDKNVVKKISLPQITLQPPNPPNLDLRSEVIMTVTGDPN